MFCVQVSTANIPVDVVMQVVSIIIALTSTNSEHFVYLCCMVISLWCFDMLKSWHWVHAGTSNAHCRVTVFLPLCNKQLIAKLLFWIMKKLQCCGSFPCHIRWFMFLFTIAWSSALCQLTTFSIHVWLSCQRVLSFWTLLHTLMIGDFSMLLVGYKTGTANMLL